jgi:hypothetical protein
MTSFDDGQEKRCRRAALIRTWKQGKVENVEVNSPRSDGAFIHVKNINELATEKK